MVPLLPVMLRHSVVVQCGSWTGFQDLPATGAVSIQELVANSGSSWLCSMAFQHVNCCLFSSDVEGSSTCFTVACSLTWSVRPTAVFFTLRMLYFAAHWVPTDLGDFLGTLGFLGHKLLVLRLGVGAQGLVSRICQPWERSTSRGWLPIVEAPGCLRYPTSI